MVFSVIAGLLTGAPTPRAFSQRFWQAATPSRHTSPSLLDNIEEALNMLWRAIPAGWVKSVWWEANKRLKKEIASKKAVGKANPIALRPAAYAVWVSLMALKAGNRGPAALARAAPTTPAHGADEGGARAPPHEAPALGEGVRASWRRGFPRRFM
jgi:hypothetical protein